MRAASLVLATSVLGGSAILAAGHSNYTSGHGGASSISAVGQKSEATPAGRPVLWREPTNIGHLDLFYGQGEKAHQPSRTCRFIKEDLDGSKPKFGVRDDSGMKWKIKLGAEARPATVASRLVWAAGYFVDEDYFIGEVQVQEMPPHVHRGQRLIGANGTMHDVRMKREPDDRLKIGSWQWASNPFSGTRELNGLRVLMAVINNWDLKDENNAIYREKHRGSADADEREYEVSDLGSSFGSAGLQRTDAESEGNLHAYRQSQFIQKVAVDEVDFNVPSRPALIVLGNPREFFSRLPLRAIGQHIPRQDAKWLGHLLAQLSADQIRDAFRAAGYSPQDVEGFAAVVQSRIAQLNAL